MITLIMITLSGLHHNTPLKYMLGMVADPVADAEYRLISIVRNDKSRC
jgi:hypothetical protein